MYKIILQAMCDVLSGHVSLDQMIAWKDKSAVFGGNNQSPAGCPTHKVPGVRQLLSALQTL